MELISLILLITLFLCIGSFSSVVIYRLILIEFSNANINLFKPRSHCPKCKKNISYIHLIPVVGYLLQQGKCINCKRKISYKYPLHELIHVFQNYAGKFENYEERNLSYQYYFRSYD